MEISPGMVAGIKCPKNSTRVTVFLVYFTCAAKVGLKKNPCGVSASGSGEVYKGIHGYTDYKAGFRREHMVSSEKAGGGRA
jgi:hypothetical protein